MSDWAQVRGFPQCSVSDVRDTALNIINSGLEHGTQSQRRDCHSRYRVEFFSFLDIYDTLFGYTSQLYLATVPHYE